MIRSSRDADGLVRGEGDAAEEVLDRLRRSECDCETAYAEAGDQAGHVQPEVLEHRHGRERGEEDLHRAASERNQAQRAGSAQPAHALRGDGAPAGGRAGSPQRTAAACWYSSQSPKR
jgi:hypothetical protein